MGGCRAMRTNARVGKRERAKMRTGGRCWYCGEHIPRGETTLDHVIPRSHGGRKRNDNLVLACKRCNQLKAAMSLDEFRSRHNDNFPFYGESREAA